MKCPPDNGPPCPAASRRGVPGRGDLLGRGLDSQFTGELYALDEYQYNGEGTTDRSAYDLARLLQGEILNVGTQYLAVMASSLVHPLVTLSATSISTLVDGSGLVSCTVQHAVTGNSGILAGAQRSCGENLTACWYYPSSLYLQFDVCFSALLQTDVEARGDDFDFHENVVILSRERRFN